MPKTIKNQTEVFLRFYASMANQPYEWVVDEYLGKHPDENGIVNNKLYPAVRYAIAETSQLLKECEPEKLYGVKITEFRAGHNQAIDAYTANIEKRLG